MKDLKCSSHTLGRAEFLLVESPRADTHRRKLFFRKPHQFKHSIGKRRRILRFHYQSSSGSFDQVGGITTHTHENRLAHREIELRLCRSEERRVGKECRSRWERDRQKKK